MEEALLPSLVDAALGQQSSSDAAARKSVTPGEPLDGPLLALAALAESGPRLRVTCLRYLGERIGAGLQCIEREVSSHRLAQALKTFACATLSACGNLLSEAERVPVSRLLSSLLQYAVDTAHVRNLLLAA